MALEIPIIDEEQYVGGQLWYRIDLTEILVTLGSTLQGVVWTITKGTSVSIVNNDMDGNIARVEVSALAEGVSMVRAMVSLNDTQKQPVFLRITVLDPN